MLREAVKFNEGVNEFCTTRSCLASVYHVVLGGEGVVWGNPPQENLEI